jgi:hypothetical protein
MIRGQTLRALPRRTERVGDASSAVLPTDRFGSGWNNWDSLRLTNRPCTTLLGATAQSRQELLGATNRTMWDVSLGKRTAGRARTRGSDGRARRVRPLTEEGSARRALTNKIGARGPL